MSKYEVLGVSRFASFQEIKSAYQAAALASHPDKQASIAAETLKKEVRVRVCYEFCVRVSTMMCHHLLYDRDPLLVLHDCDSTAANWSSNQPTYFAPTTTTGTLHALDAVPLAFVTGIGEILACPRSVGDPSRR